MIYVFEVTARPAARLEEYVETWITESKIIQNEPGALGTRLHRSVDREDQALAIASWASKQLRDEAMKRLENHRELIELRARHKKLVDFRLIGEFEDPEWIVLPNENLTQTEGK